MAAAPQGETAADRRRQWYLGIVTVVALLAILGNLVLGTLVHTDQGTILNKDAQLVAKDVQIVKLLHQHTVTFEQQQKQARQTNVFLKDLGLLATYLIESNEAVCVASHAQCPTLPTLPPVPRS